jgi:LmbE family N-acetylglucosaminyl deacetylase
LDDAVLSAGATLAGMGEAGFEVVNCTVFAGDPVRPLTDAAVRFHAECGLGDDAVARRRAEDLAAAAVLHVHTRHLPFPDAVYRRVGGRAVCCRPGALFSAEPADELDLLAAIEAALLAVVIDLRPALVMSCAATGSHVDHRMVRLAVDRITCRGHLPIAHWDDIPYVMWRGSSVGTALLPIAVLEQHLEAKLRAVAQYHSQLQLLWRGSDWSTAIIQHATARLDRGEPAEGFQLAARHRR